MADWSELMKPDERLKRRILARSLLLAVEEDCMTRKPRDPAKRDLMRQLGLPERYQEVQYPSPGNTPPEIYEEEL
jgi:hypothetical protein